MLGTTSLGSISPSALVPSAGTVSTALFETQRTALWLLQSSSDDGDEGDLFFIVLAGFAAGLYLIYDGFDTWQLSQLLQDTPTSKVRSMSVGRVELEGTARKREESVTPPLTEAECIYVDWEAEKREKHRDEDGDVHYTWDTIGSGRSAYQFDLEDDTGSVLIRADVDDPEFDINQGSHRHQQTYGRGESAPADVRHFVSSGGDPQAVAVGSEDDGGLLDSVTDVASDLATDSLSDTGRRRRYSENVMTVGSHAYVFGSAEPREGASMDAGEADLLEIRRHTGTDEFLVSDSREEELQDSYSKWGPVKIFGGLALSAICLFVLLWKYRVHELLV